MGIILIVAIVEGLLGAGVLLFLAIRAGAKETANLALFDKEIEKRESTQDQIKTLFGQLVPWSNVREIALTLNEQRELIKLERGRVTITQAELETVENRLRELEEVEREIAASGIETKEEFRILNKKEKDLKTKNDNLVNQIAESMNKLQEVLSQVESNSQVMVQVDMAKTELLRTEQKVNELLIQIELGNEQYVTMKQVYDALDIEYAQLYEKFSESNPG
jgi:chromosome segregation ATPase